MDLEGVSDLVVVAVGFPFLSFTIGSTEFAYGFVLSAAIAFIVVCLLAIPLWRAHLRYDGLSETRNCPECITPIPLAAKRCPIPLAAKRCPECTAVVTPGTA